MAIRYASLKQRVYALFDDWDKYNCASAKHELERLFEESKELRRGSQLRIDFSWLEKELGITNKN